MGRGVRGKGREEKWREGEKKKQIRKIKILNERERDRDIKKT